MAKQTTVLNKVDHVVVDVAEILALQVTVAGKKQLDTYANKIVYLTGTLNDILKCQGVTGVYSCHARPSDVQGCTAEYVPGKGWVGCLGQFDTEQAYASYITSTTNIGTGTTVVVGKNSTGTSVRLFDGVSFQSVAGSNLPGSTSNPFPDAAARDTWAAANPGELLNGLEKVQTIGGTPTRIRYDGYGRWIVTQDPIELASETVITPTHTIGGVGGWGLSGGGIYTITQENARIPGRSVLKIDCTGASGDRYINIRRAISRIPFSGPLEFWYWIDAPISQFDIRFIYSSDAPNADPPTANATNAITYYGFNALLKRASWNRLCIDPLNVGSMESTIRAVAGSPNAQELRQIYPYIFFSSALPAENRVAYIDVVSLGQRQRSKTFFTYDGGADNALRVVTPMLAARSLKMPAIFNDRNAAISASDLLLYNALISQGWEIGCNGQNHKNYGADWSTLDSDCAAAEAFFVDAGITRPTLFGAPVGGVNGHTDAILAARGYRGCRGAGMQNFILNKDSSFQAFASTSIENGVSSATILGRLDNAIACGSHFAMHFHAVVDTVTTPGVQVSTAIFTEILDGITARIAAGKLDSTTMGDFCRLHK